LLRHPVDSAHGPEANALRERRGWEVVGPPPF